MCENVMLIMYKDLVSFETNKYLCICTHINTFVKANVPHKTESMCLTNFEGVLPAGVLAGVSTVKLGVNLAKSPITVDNMHTDKIE